MQIVFLDGRWWHVLNLWIEFVLGQAIGPMRYRLDLLFRLQVHTAACHSLCVHELSHSLLHQASLSHIGSWSLKEGRWWRFAALDGRWHRSVRLVSEWLIDGRRLRWGCRHLVRLDRTATTFRCLLLSIA